MNITPSVDERVLEQAQRDAVIEELRSLALKGCSPEPGWRFDREAIYGERPSPSEHFSRYLPR